MRTEVAVDLSDSAYDFMRVVWPEIKDLLTNGVITPVEAIALEREAAPAAKQLAQDLDILAGVDAWHVSHTVGAMRGIASRVQWSDKCWRTFTVRKERPSGQKTELEKRLYALDNPNDGWLLPALTVHAYITEPRRHGRLLGAAVMRTADLYAYARANPCRRPRRNPADGVLFDWWDWDLIKAAGHQVGIVPRDEQAEERRDWPAFTFGPQLELFEH